MGNRCYEKYGETIVIRLNDSYYHYKTVSIHYECFPKCECGEVYCDRMNGQLLAEEYFINVTNKNVYLAMFQFLRKILIMMDDME
mgnify:CR=1 FL=1